MGNDNSIGLFEETVFSGFKDNVRFLFRKNRFVKNDKSPVFFISINGNEVPLWPKTSKSGEKYIGGQDENNFYGVFINKFKTENDNQPKYRLLISPRQNQTEEKPKAQNSSFDDFLGDVPL